MTITETPVTDLLAGPALTPVSREDLRLVPVVLNTYRDIHKGIRSSLFHLTEDTGRADASDVAARRALAARFTTMAAVLESHAGHEDSFIQPALERYEPRLADAVERDHILLERRIYGLVSLADELASEGARSPRHLLDELYLGTASFTSAYLAHQDLEERVVMPRLEAAVGVDAVVAMHEAIIASIPPQELADGLAMMLPAMNIDDRVEMLAGMRATAPREVFEGVLQLAEQVIGSANTQAVLARLP